MGIATLLSGGAAPGLPSVSATSKSGDAATGPLDNGQGYGFSQTSNFSVGSGSATGGSTASATPATDSGSGLNASTLLYVGLGLVALVVLMPILQKR